MSATFSDGCFFRRTTDEKQRGTLGSNWQYEYAQLVRCLASIKYSFPQISSAVIWDETVAAGFSS